MDLVGRVKGILLNPKNEWNVIETEPATIGSLYTTYIIPLALIPVIARFIGYSVLSNWFPISMGLQLALTSLASSLISTYILALLIDALAPNFGGQKSQIQALKVAAYSSTAFWIAGIFTILPAITVLAILGLYSFYLLYLGLPALMKSSTEKSTAYTVVVIVAAIVVGLVFAAITNRFMPSPLTGMYTR